MSGKRRTELIDVFKAEAANVKALAMQALDADISLLQVAPVIILWTQYWGFGWGPGLFLFILPLWKAISIDCKPLVKGRYYE